MGDARRWLFGRKVLLLAADGFSSSRLGPACSSGVSLGNSQRKDGPLGVQSECVFSYGTVWNQWHLGSCSVTPPRENCLPTMVGARASWQEGTGPRVRKPGSELPGACGFIYWPQVLHLYSGDNLAGSP